MESQPQQQLVYHEPQLARLCGMHSVNNLLQGPWVDLGTLHAIVKRLEERYQSIVGGAGKVSYNGQMVSPFVTPSGDFDVQVLSAAIQEATASMANLLPLRKPELADLRAAPADGSCYGYLCNKDDHWYALRKLHDHWWVIDSMNDAPQRVSAFYLGWLIQEQQRMGYTVYAALGTLPDPIPGHGWGENYHTVDVLLQRFNRAAAGGGKTSESEFVGSAESRRAVSSDSSPASVDRLISSSGQSLLSESLSTSSRGSSGRNAADLSEADRLGMDFARGLRVASNGLVLLQQSMDM